MWNFVARTIQIRGIDQSGKQEFIMSSTGLPLDVITYCI